MAAQILSTLRDNGKFPKDFNRSGMRTKCTFEKKSGLSCRTHVKKEENLYPKDFRRYELSLGGLFDGSALLRLFLDQSQ